MRPPTNTVQVQLAEPLNDPYTLEQLAQFNGSDPSKPIYVAVNRIVFDVSGNPDNYGPGKAYNLFTGKDVSRALAKSILKHEACVPDIDDIDDEEKQVLNDWVDFYKSRYNIVGRVVL